MDYLPNIERNFEGRGLTRRAETGPYEYEHEKNEHDKKGGLDLVLGPVGEKHEMEHCAILDGERSETSHFVLSIAAQAHAVELRTLDGPEHLEAVAERLRLLNLPQDSADEGAPHVAWGARDPEGLDL